MANKGRARLTKEQHTSLTIALGEFPPADIFGKHFTNNLQWAGTLDGLTNMDPDTLGKALFHPDGWSVLPDTLNLVVDAAMRTRLMKGYLDSEPDSYNFRQGYLHCMRVMGIEFTEDENADIEALEEGR